MFFCTRGNKSITVSGGQKIYWDKYSRDFLHCWSAPWGKLKCYQSGFRRVLCQRFVGSRCRSIFIHSTNCHRYDWWGFLAFRFWTFLVLRMAFLFCGFTQHSVGTLRATKRNSRLKSMEAVPIILLFNSVFSKRKEENFKVFVGTLIYSTALFVSNASAPGDGKTFSMIYALLPMYNFFFLFLFTFVFHPRQKVRHPATSGSST